MDHYESTAIILNAQLGSKPASFTWKRSRTAFFACRFEKPTESESFWVIVISLQEAVWKMLLDAAQSVLDTLSSLENSPLYPRVAIQVVLLLVSQIPQSNWNVYWSAMTTFISGPESSWQKSVLCQTSGDIQALKKKSNSVTMKHHLLVLCFSSAEQSVEKEAWEMYLGITGYFSKSILMLWMSIM